MAGWAYMDAEFCPIEEARLPLLDPGFTRGDAVYDTVSVWKGNFFRLEDHLDRFERSLQQARLSPPVDRAERRRILAEVVERAGLEDAYVQMLSTRGPFPDPTVRDPRTCINTFIAYAIPYMWIVKPERQLQGIDLVIARGNRRTPPESIDPRMKNFNWLDMARGQFEALDRGGEHVVLCTPDGRLSEGPGFNLFLARNGELLTPEGNALEGITRRTVLELCQLLGIPARAGDLTPEDLLGADEAFLSSTAGGVMPVATVDGSPLKHGTGPGPLSLQLREEYWARREAGWHATPVATLVA
jgi:branched-chain amino acid aminotransferase